MHFRVAALFALSSICPVLAQTSSDSSGYTDYSLNINDSDGSTIYETASTDTSNGTSNFPPPDVFLNASVSVGEIDVLVEKLSAKINLDAQVLSLLDFNAGVNVEIGKVQLLIQNVSAKVELEVRLANVVKMINSTLNSIDLNPIIAELGNAVGDITGDVGDLLNGATGSGSNSTSSSGSGLSSRSFTLEEEILYSLNDYSGNTHTNRVLEQNGDVVDQSLDNEGHVYTSTVVGTYATLMTKIGEPKEGVIIDGFSATQQEYLYIPTHLSSFGLEAVCYIYTNAAGDVVATRVIAEVEAGGYSSISGEEDEDLK